ncbi:MAG: hypothetical protein CSA05_03660 [Bacteroidia bacterium]|nr:MAG: hypothetical protein CSA05_03660 [Bacteroidia bacterium]
MEYGYQAILDLEGEEAIKLSGFSSTYTRDVNEKTGEVQSFVKNGTIYANYEDCPNDDIWEWALKYKFKNGKIRLMHTDSNNGTFIKNSEVAFEEAACAGLKLSYSRYGISHFLTQLIITANTSGVGDTSDKVKRDWLFNE